MTEGKAKNIFKVNQKPKEKVARPRLRWLQEAEIAFGGLKVK
jgi:hypothetical protein